MLKVITRKDKNNLGFKIVDISMDNVENEYNKVYDKLWRKVHGIIYDDLTGLKEIYQEEDLYDIVTEQDDIPRCVITLSCTAKRKFSWKCIYKIHFYILCNNTRYSIYTKVIDDANSSVEIVTHLMKFCNFIHW